MQSLPGSGQLSRSKFGILFLIAWAFQLLAYGLLIGISIQYHSRDGRRKLPGEFPTVNPPHLLRLKGGGNLDSKSRSTRLRTEIRLK
jgi:hypothetical protein